MRTAKLCARVLLTVAMSAGVTTVFAQAYPTKSVRMLVGFAPAGATDIVARLVSPGMTEALGQSVIVDNRPGASSLIAGEIVAKAPPDGYTIFMVTQTLINAGIIEGRKFPDLARDFDAVGLAASTPLVLVVNNSLPVKTPKDLIALARAKPGALDFGSGGVGATPHMSGELFAKLAKLKIVHVPYKGEGPALVDTIAGHLPMMFSNITAAMPHVQAGKLRAIAVTSLKPVPSVPGVPSLAESGLPGYEVVGWFGIVAPGKTAAPVVKQLNDALRKVLARSDLKEKFASQALQAGELTPQQYAAFIRSEVDKWGKLIREIGLVKKKS